MPEDRFPSPECSGDLRVMENRWTADVKSHFSPEFAFRVSLLCVLFKTWWCVTVGKCLHFSCLYARCLDYGPERNKIRQEVHHSTADFIDFSSPALIFRFTLRGIMKGIYNNKQICVYYSTARAGAASNGEYFARVQLPLWHSSSTPTHCIRTVVVHNTLCRKIDIRSWTWNSRWGVKR